MITGHCIDCMGTGLKKVKDMIGTTRATPCLECGGLGGKIMKEGSGEHRIAANIGAMRKGMKEHVKEDDIDESR